MLRYEHKQTATYEYWFSLFKRVLYSIGVPASAVTSIKFLGKVLINEFHE